MSLATEQQIRTAAKMYEARDAVRLLLGDRYPERMKRLGEQLRSAASEAGLDTLAMALRACKAATAQGRPGVALQILAAAVELSEPNRKVSGV